MKRGRDFLRKVSGENFFSKKFSPIIPLCQTKKRNTRLRSFCCFQLRFGYFAFCCGFFRGAFCGCTVNNGFTDGFGDSGSIGCRGSVCAQVNGILNEVGYENEESEHDSNNGGQLGELVIDRGALFLAEESFRAAGVPPF